MVGSAKLTLWIVAVGTTIIGLIALSIVGAVKALPSGGFRNVSTRCDNVGISWRASYKDAKKRAKEHKGSGKKTRDLPSGPRAQ
jgi:hypothetical protein